MFIRILHSQNFLTFHPGIRTIKFRPQLMAVGMLLADILIPVGEVSAVKNGVRLSRFAGFLYPSFCISVRETQELFLESDVSYSPY